ncbi:integrase core domain-containing protein, partial [Salipiger sp. 1_MG-2023]|uniref:integrase core domain-containing protein n=1 Tax=Salipiger sp. 1_MG-2023 TaxID=3062665 RepID=UPI0026E370C1
ISFSSKISRLQIIAYVSVRISGGSSVILDWTADFNETRPHSALGYQTPKEFAEHLTTATDTRAAPAESSARMSVAPPAPIGVSTQRTPVPAG